MVRLVTFLVGLVCGGALTGAVVQAIGSKGDQVAPERDRAVPLFEPSSSTEDAAVHRPVAVRARRSVDDPLAGIDESVFERPAAGTGRISGMVLERDGRPLGGVLVRADSTNEPPTVHEPPTDDQEERLRRDLRDTVREYRWRRSSSFETRSDASGTFEFNGLPGSDWRLTATCAGWDISRAGGGEPWSPVRDGDEVVFAARRRTEVDISVARADGSPVDHARIELEQRDGESDQMDWTQQASRIPVRPGTWRVRATAGVDAEMQSPQQDLVVAEDGPPASLRLVVVERPALVLTVDKTPPGGPLGIRIRLTPEFERAATSRAARNRWSELAVDPSGAREDWTTPGGRVVFLDLVPGSWTLTLSNGTGVEFHREALEVTGTMRREIAIPDRDLRDWVLARPLSPEGRPAVAVRFEIGYSSPGGSAGGYAKAIPVGNGRWRIPAFVARFGREDGASWTSGHPETEKATRRWVRASTEEWGRASAVIDPALDGEVVLHFEMQAHLTVTVAGADLGLERLQVGVEPAEAEDEETGAGTFAQAQEVIDGAVQFRTLPPRPAHIVLTLQDDFESVELQRSALSLASGENRVTLEVPVLQELRVGVPDDVDPHRLELHRCNPDGEVVPCSHAEIRGQSAIWRHLAAGKYRAFTSDGDMQLSIPCAPDVRFAPRAFTAIRFSVSSGVENPAGPRDGDVGVALDGVEFESPRHIDALLAAAKLKSRSRLTVLRAGRRIELEVDVSSLTVNWDYASR